MMDNMAPFMFALVAAWVATVISVIGMAATRLYLVWLWLGTVLFYALWWLLLGYPPLIPPDV